MICWLTPRMETPACLVGAPIARVHCEAGDQVTLAQYADRLPIAAPFVALTGGYSAAKVGAWQPSDYRRATPWAVALSVVDGFGTEWEIPAILSPEGVPICDRSWVLNADGSWGRQSVSEIQDRAIAAAQAAFTLVHSPEEIPPESLLPWACAILESAYHLDAATIGRLGLLTTTGALAIVRGAAGWVP